MARQTIKDRTGKTLGYIEDQGDTRQQAVAANGKILGYYDRKQDRTFDTHGVTVGHGNFLVSLLAGT